MAPQPPQLPTKFPFWCRAVYSWGGETKRDLGFVEGDLIECLNAGDGSWWTGRLRRDRRMVGLFPSNFVKILEDNFVPASRSVSPLPPGLNDSSNSVRLDGSGPKKQKTVFRKPFQGYKEVVGPSAELAKKKAERAERAEQIERVERIERAERAAKEKAEKEKAEKAEKALTVYRPTQRSQRSHPPPRSLRQTPSVTQRAKNYGALSRIPSRAVSPVPIPSPAPELEDSPPPPPPPPHRIAVRSQEPPRRSSSPPDVYHSINRSYQTIPRTPSPCPPSPSIHGHTPSPLRDAMEDVMSSLQDMGMSRGAPSPQPGRSPSPINPWSPEAFDQLRERDAPNSFNRPATSFELEDSNRTHYDDHPNNHSSESFLGRHHDGPPQLGNYVQRMESRLRQLHEREGKPVKGHDFDDIPPPTPPKGDYNYASRQQPLLKHRKSAYELGRDMLERTFTTKSTTTNSSSGVQSTTTNSSSNTALTDPSVMSGFSAGGFSATSAGSFARRNKVNSSLRHGASSSMDNSRSKGFTGFDSDSDAETRPYTTETDGSYRSSKDNPRHGATSAVGWAEYNGQTDSPSVFGGLTTPKSKKSGFLKRILESAKTGAATARSNVAANRSSGSLSPTKGLIPTGISGLSSDKFEKDTARDSGLGGNDWVQVRRDVNRSTSPSHNELVERVERCQMLEFPVIYSVEELYESAEGDEGIDGLPITEPTDFAAVNLQLVDKSSRFINSLPPMTNPTSLAQGYVCRPHRSDVQRLRAIFTWVAEKIGWDDDIEGDVDVRRVIQMKRGCAQEVAVLVMEMCSAVGLHAEVVNGFLKSPGQQLDLDSLSRPNHWWNTVLIDGEWRIMDCSLASPTHPGRSLYSSFNPQAAESYYFLTRPMEICYTHIPLAAEHQHICPPISPEVLLALPCACPGYFKNGLHIPIYDTSLIQINDLEIVQIRVQVPWDVECVAEVEAIGFARDEDGDFFESGDIIKKRALAQPDWIHGEKRFTIKALLPGDEGQGILKVYAGKKGLMHSSKDIPYALSFALPIVHQGDNPPYDFILRHPTPHAQRHDLYVIQPQCSRLAINNTFVFAVRQHPSTLPSVSSNQNEASGRVSPNPFARPSSSLSMVSSITISNASTTSIPGRPSSNSGSINSGNKQQSVTREKPAKLAVQTPSGKILRLTRKADHMITTSTGTTPGQDGPADGSVWETVIKVSERGIWRGLVLADRSARWCVWGEWECF